MNRKIVKLQGFNIDTFSMDEACEYILENRGQVVTINPEIIELGKKNEDLKTIINSAELVIPDGIGVQIGLKILGYKVKRIPGIVFARKILENSVSNNLRVALIGSRPEVIEKTVEKLKVEIPGINIVFSHDGYFKDDEKLFNDIINSSPDIVFFALGAPRQEECIYSIKKSLPKAIMIGIGGSFDVWSGNVQRAPEIYQNLGLEWLYRTVKEPKRLKRIFPTLPKFIFSVIKESWGKTC